MKQIKRFSYFLKLKKAMVLFTFGFLMSFGFTSNGQFCECNGPVVGTNVGIPTLSQSGINTSVPFTGCIVVNGEFTVDDNWTVSGGNILMEAGAEIFVAPIWDPAQQAAIEFAVIDSEINGCNRLWKSITLLSLDWGLGARLRLEGSTIRDGEYAINLPANNAQLTVINNTFDANYVGIYSPPNISTISIIQPELITGNTFESTYGLLLHYDNINIGTIPKAGVELNDMEGFIIGTVNGNSNNIFTNLRNGVILKDSYYCIVGGNTFIDLVSPDINSEEVGVVSRDCFGTGVRNNNMSGLQKAFFGVNTGSVIFGNSINSDWLGLVIRNCVNKRNWIGDNIIESPFACIQTNDISSNDDNAALIIEGNPSLISTDGSAVVLVNQAQSKITIQDNLILGHSGIAIDGSTGAARIENNNITLVGTPNIIVGLGIQLASSENCQVLNNIINENIPNSLSSFGIIGLFAPNNLYCCNEVNGTYWGFQFKENCMDTRWNTTTFGEHVFGVSLENAIIGTQTNTGNNFAIGDLTKDARFSGNQFLIPFSPIVTDPSLMTNGLTNIVVPPGSVASDWFTLDGTDITCQTSPYCGETPYPLSPQDPNDFGELSPTDIEVSEFDANTEISDLLKWETKRYLYKKLKNNLELVTVDNQVNNFFNQAQNDRINDFYIVNKGLKELFYPSPNQTIILLGLEEEAKILLDEVNIIRQNILSATSSEKTILIESQKDKTANLIPKLNNIKSLRTQIKQQQYQNVDYLIAVNKTLEPTHIFQSNEKIINQIFLETIGKDIYGFTDGQKNIINSIANQCVSIGGTSVLRARALQKYYSDISYDLESGCGDENARKGNSQDQVISIYPNPNYGKFSIQFEYPIEEKLDLELYDINGRLLFTDKLLIGEFDYNFNDLNLESGLYILKLRSTNGNILTRKVVINKF